MKKWLALVLVIIMTLGNLPALGEEFTLRNGVQFGDTIAQVRAKETIPFKEDECDETTLWTQKGSVAGFSDVQIAYFFDEEGKLEEVKWQLPDRTSTESSDADYEKLYKAFVSKYGSPLGYDNGDCHIITTRAFDGGIMIAYMYDMMDGYGDERDYDEWIYEYGNGHNVKIDMLQFYNGASYSAIKYRIWIGYKYFSDADLQEARQEKQNEQQSVLNDI